MLHILAFAAVCAVDVAWVAYMWAADAKRPFIAGGLAASLYLASGAATIFYVDDNAVLVAGALGAFVGTAVAVYWRKRLAATAEVNVPGAPERLGCTGKEAP